MCPCYDYCYCRQRSGSSSSAQQQHHSPLAACALAAYCCGALVSKPTRTRPSYDYCYCRQQQQHLPLCRCGALVSMPFPPHLPASAEQRLLSRAGSAKARVPRTAARGATKARAMLARRHVCVCVRALQFRSERARCARAAVQCVDARATLCAPAVTAVSELKQWEPAVPGAHLLCVC